MNKLIKTILRNKKVRMVTLSICALALCVGVAGVYFYNKHSNNEEKKNVVEAVKKVESNKAATTEAKLDTTKQETQNTEVKAVPQFVEKKFNGKTTVAVNLRVNPSQDADKIIELRENTVVEVSGTQGEWYKVKYDSKEGWINSKYLKEYTDEDRKADEAAAKKQKEEAEQKQKEEAEKKKASSSPAASSNQNTTATNTAASNNTYKKGFRNPALSNSSQVILVTTSSMSSSYANIKLYQKNGEDWTVKEETSGRVGSNGLAYISNRVQSSDKTPAGVIGILNAFGVSDNPGSKYSYTKVTDDMYWDLNNGSPTYNRLIHNNPGGDFEHLASYPVQYKYALVTDYNVNQTPNKGGAIFVHCNGSGGTAGCVSMPEGNMRDLVTWVDPSQNPKIVIIPSSDLAKYWY
jgi:L,D-peptidoglycan transpeptidase YkuD (ErfK/YbiS/YcfS/YnhG family)